MSEGQMTPSQVKELAMTATLNGEYERAAELLRSGSVPGDKKANAWQSVIDSCLSKDMLDSALAVAFELVHVPVDSSVFSSSNLDALLRALQQSQSPAGRSIDLVRQCVAAGVHPGDSAMNTLLDNTVRTRAYNEAWEVLELILTCGSKTDKYFVSILTKSLESTSDRRQVRRGITLVDRFIDQQRDDVDEIVFNSLLNVLGQIGDMQKMQMTLEKMRNFRVAPSAVTYGTIVKAYGRNKDIESVLKVWEEMRHRNLGVNPVTCGCVLDACVKCGFLEKALEIFQEMRAQGLHKNTVLYATLIKGLAKTRDLAAAVKLYQEMRKEKVPCNLVVFNSLMDVCVRAGDLHTAALFLQDMMSMGIEPDLITFSTLIKGYSHTGEVHKAMALKQELKSRGLKCDEIMYNSLIDGCAKGRLPQEGLAVFHDMMQSGVQPSNITFSILLKLYFDCGQVDEGFQMVEEMATKYRCPPSRVAYSVLFRLCGQRDLTSLTKGVALIRDISNRRGGSKVLDADMIAALATGLAQRGDATAAADLLFDYCCSRKYVSLGLSRCARIVFDNLSLGDQGLCHDLVDLLKKRGAPASFLSQLGADLKADTGARRPAPLPASTVTGNQSLSIGLEKHTARDTAASAPAADASYYNWSGADDMTMAAQYHMQQQPGSYWPEADYYHQAYHMGAMYGYGHGNPYAAAPYGAPPPAYGGMGYGGYYGHAPCGHHGHHGHHDVSGVHAIASAAAAAAAAAVQQVHAQHAQQQAGASPTLSAAAGHMNLATNPLGTQQATAAAVHAITAAAIENELLGGKGGKGLRCQAGGKSLPQEGHDQVQQPPSFGRLGA
eukprot:TRINITY_DN101778_c0_g1_i1.p1 TRINITY_DN101778_c0_g1~~TRINITY_DN101778_c0_g1_i1.p1  ORF type:complete len:833 (-),score=192.42 TRINITY_DN101778_c0_g1_i1:166-2664(-)